jgi:RNA polymerase sigma factor (sigma-70 family)
MKTNTPNQNGSGSVNDAQHNLSVSDAQHNLVELAKQGNHNAYTQIVNESKGKLYSTLSGMLRNHSDAEDILQETIAKGYRYIKGFNGKSSVHTWLHTIAVNTAINFIRKRNKEGFSYSINDEESGVEFRNDFLEAISLNGADVDMVNKELGEAIHEAMDKLSNEHRTIVQMFDIDGYSHGEIAEIIGVNENTVRSRLFYAHKRLQGMLAEYKEVIK